MLRLQSGTLSIAGSTATTGAGTAEDMMNVVVWPEKGL